MRSLNQVMRIFGHLEHLLKICNNVNWTIFFSSWDAPVYSAASERMSTATAALYVYWRGMPNDGFIHMLPKRYQKRKKRLNHYYTHRPRYSTSRERGKEIQCHNQPYKSVAELRIISLWRSQSFGPVDENPASSCHRFVCRIKQYSL